MIKLLNYIVIFFLIIFLVVFILVLYNSVKPSNSDSNPLFDFQPYPQISPKNIPDNNIDDTSKSCYKFLTKCDPKQDSQCSSCISDFICTKVDKKKGVNSNILLNDQLVPDGDWCLPQLPPNDKKCNSFTGRWVWSNNEECQNDKSNSQCWKCECLYPDLFSGIDCSTQLACKAVKTNADKIPGQHGNVLKSTTANPLGAGIQWNPKIDMTAGTTNSKEINVLIEQTPYMSASGTNKPYFECSCDGQYCKTPEDCKILGPLPDGDKWACDTTKNLCVRSFPDPDKPGNYIEDITFNPYVKLPNDPFMCHINPCTPLNANHYADKININTEGSQYKCDCNANGFMEVNDKFDATKTNNTLFGTCILNETLPCPFSTRNKECLCLTGYNRKCRSKYANIDDTSMELCQDRENPIGFECYDPCPAENCNFRGIASYKLGKCSVDNLTPCRSNSDCIENGICKYPDDCTCTCGAGDVCATINNLYKKTDGQNVIGLPDTQLENVCNKYSEICKYDTDRQVCIVKENNIPKPFPACNNPYFGGKQCEKIFCDKDTQISVITGQGDGYSNYNVNDNLKIYCENTRGAFPTKGQYCVTDKDQGVGCVVTCEGKQGTSGWND
jgi:hypothetical protein